MKYRITNQAYQPIRLTNIIIPSRDKRPKNIIFVVELTDQIKNLARKGILKIKRF